MTTKTFYPLVGDCVGQDKMNKKVKGAIKERLTDLMETERRKGSKAATATREEDKEEKERRSTRDSQPTEKMAAYLGNLHPPSKINTHAIFTIDVESTLHAAISHYHSQQDNSKNDISKHASSLGKQWYDKLPHQEQRQIDDGIHALLYEGCMVAARRIFDTVVLQKMANEEGDAVEYRRSNLRGEGQLALPYDFYVGQLVNVIEGKVSHQARIEKIENEKATVRWLNWKGGAVA